MRLLCLSLFALHGLELAVAAFVPSHARRFSRTPVLLQMAKKKKKKNKPSFAERQRQRAEKRRRQAQVPDQPANLENFESKEEEPAPEQAVATTADADSPEMERAKQMLAAQRQSVDMLTHVRKCVEALPFEDISSELESKGYSVVDNFLKDDKIVTQLQQEGSLLQQEDLMELDVEHGIGSGEYVTLIKGGEEQYQRCPRSIEYIVSVTKHLPPKLILDNNEELDASASIGNMRTYSRKARLASIALLTGKEDSETDLNSPDRPYRLVVDQEAEQGDARRVSLLYYPLSSEWDADCGGGVTFETSGEFMEAKRDRLVLLKSDTCLHRHEPWKGRDGLETASCIELHLVKKAQSD